MKTSFSYAKGSGKCSYCPVPIEVGEPVVVGRLPVNNNGKFFYARKRWHPNCFVEQGLQWLSLHPGEPVTKGRPKSVTATLPVDDKLARLSLLRRHATTSQRLRREMEKEWPNYEVITRLTERLDKLRLEVELVGGAPKSWLPKIEEELNSDSDPAATSDSTEYSSCC